MSAAFVRLESVGSWITSALVSIGEPPDLRPRKEVGMLVSSWVDMVWNPLGMYLCIFPAKARALGVVAEAVFPCASLCTRTRVEPE